MRSSRLAGVSAGAVVLFTAVLTAVLTVLVTGTARAQDPQLEEARSAVYQADFDRAREIFTSILASPTLDRATATDAHRYLAGLESNRDGAFRHALAAVALQPDVAPPEGMSSVRRLLDEAREALGGAALSVELRLETTASGRVVIATLVPPVSGVVDELQLDCGGGPVVQPLDSGAEARAEIPDGPYECHAAAVTEAGAALARGELREAPPPVIGPVQPPPAASSSGAPIWPWIAAGGAAAVLTVVIIVVAAGSGGSSSGMVELGPVTVEPWR